MLKRNFEELSVIFTKKYQEMLDVMFQSNIQISQVDPLVDQFVYYKINGYSSVWTEDDEKQPFEYMADVLTGMYASGAPFSIIFNGCGGAINVYIGTSAQNEKVLKRLLDGSFPNIKYKHNSNDFDDNDIKYYTAKDIINSDYSFGGYIKGNPGIAEKVNITFGINKVVNGMGDANWVISIFAIPCGKVSTYNKFNKWLSEATACSELFQVSFGDSDGKESSNHQKKYFACEEYYKKVNQFIEKLSSSVDNGEWLTTINYGADSKTDANILSSLFVSAYHGVESVPEPLHSIENMNGFVVVADGSGYNHTKYNSIPYSFISQSFNTYELAYVSMFPTRDEIGFSLDEYVDFDVSQNQKGNVTIGNILVNGRVTEQEYKVDVNSFNRHCLVIGLTGGGKTNTIKSLFNSIVNTTKGEMPFLVLEPAKREYWELYKFGFNDLQVYSIGSDIRKGNQYCINPFEKIGDTPLQTHIDYVFSAFKASFIMYTPMPYVLETAIHQIYVDCGWDIKTGENKRGEIYPTIEDLYYKIPEVVIDMGYDTKMQKDLTGSLQARINSLRIGNKGKTLNVLKSFDIGKILNGHVVVELEDIGDDDVKAFIMSLFLIQLSEYRKLQDDCQTSIRHLLLIEEAHRLLKNVRSGTGENADPRGAAVDFFCNLLAELRSKGQGFIVADQIPSKLAPDLIKNTNIKILHRTVEESERLLMGGAMHMNLEQKEQIAAFSQGIAAVYSEGDYRPKLVRTKYAKVFELPERSKLTRQQVLSSTSSNCLSAEGLEVISDRLPACIKCDRRCRKNPRDILSRIRPMEYKVLADSINPKKIKPCTSTIVREHIEKFVVARIEKQDSPSFRSDVNCIFVSLLDDWGIKETTKNKLIKGFLFKVEE